ncbi:MAG: hypothetical protein QGF18_02905 [Alphaproteobacteria bacterium]|jgi:hypothetical protein|nr:hypothetical protein [Alphaproteobacteria bacterium]MDP7190380.1 hypothetical protein [Alphaproteobacteria bacterium]|tara:strand:- start:625 stop:774 length:150 start_codon:yes stop_codon:yes gene_type:complete
MNPRKWKSVVVPISVYRYLRERAQVNHRTIGGELTHWVEKMQTETEEAA